MDLQEFEIELKEYQFRVAEGNTESYRANIFLDFIRLVFPDAKANYPHKFYPQLEKSLRSNKTILSQEIKGRMDAFSGNLIIEFESSMINTKKHEAMNQLKRYVSILWNNLGVSRYICVANDGLVFSIYKPISKLTENFTPNDIELLIIDEFDLRKEEAKSIYQRFDRYFFDKSLIVPSGLDIVFHFGAKGQIISECINILNKALEQSKEKVESRFNEWNKYLNYAYGSQIESTESVELFLRHTYLATLTKLMVCSYFQENLLHSETSYKLVFKILSGTIFKEYGIENFLVEDFFSWIIDEKLQEFAIELSNVLIKGLERYDLTKLNEDIFKDLYQQLVDPKERHDLGEFYTPDWLAELMVKEVVLDPFSRVIDPSCGSGTFLASTIRRKKVLLGHNNLSKIAGIISRTTYGIDIHPVALLFSKANYIMALGDSLLKREEDGIIIPIYLADSITFPEPIHRIPLFGTNNEEQAYGYEAYKNTLILLPKSLVDSGKADPIIDRMRDFAIKKSNGQAIPLNIFRKMLDPFGITNNQFDIIIDTAEKLSDLITKKKDSIHSFILKNIYKPSTLSKFDVIIGNPPWITYKDINRIERQRKLQNLAINSYALLEKGNQKLFTQMEIATLFFVRCCDVYLKEYGKIAFVLPRSIFTGDQHRKFRENSYSIKIGYTQIFDLEKNQKERVSPLFNVESCVLFGEKSIDTKYPIETRLLQGRLPNKNASLHDIDNLIRKNKFTISSHKTKIITVGNRNAWNYDEDVKFSSVQSPYMKLFRQGATIIPRSCWMVQIDINEKLGGLSNIPFIKTSDRSIKMSKQLNTAYRNIDMKGNVEKEYLFATLLGSDILPFCHLPFRLSVLPIIPLNHCYKMILKEDALNLGHNNFYQWLEQAEILWDENRKEKRKKMDIYQRLNRNNALIKQNPNPKFAILYNSAGRNNLVGCVLDFSNLDSVFTKKFNGFIAEHKTYISYTDDKHEAFYLVSLLNSDFIFSIVKKIKSARDIEKKVWELPIPKFSSLNSTHNRLSEIAEICSLKSGLELQTIIKESNDEEIFNANNSGILRKKLKEILNKEIQEINKLTMSIISNTNSEINDFI